MGDMADFALDEVCIAEDLRHQHVAGAFSLQESYDHAFIHYLDNKD